MRISTYAHVETPDRDLVALELIHAASEPFASWYFGDEETAKEILTEWIQRETSEVFVGAASVALDEEDIAGLLVAHPGHEIPRRRAADFAALLDDLGGGDEAEAVANELAEAGRDLFGPVPDDMLYVSRIAVHPLHRRKGVGQALMAEAHRLARSMGLDGVHLDVSADNVGAIALYRASNMIAQEPRSSSLVDMRYRAMQTPRPTG